jgi:hypothetical protein
MGSSWWQWNNQASLNGGTMLWISGQGKFNQGDV